MEQKNPPEGAKDGLHNVGEILEVLEEGDLLEIAEIEIYAKEGKPLPRAKKYKFRIDREHFTVDHHVIRGEELFKLAQKSPEKWRMHEKLHGGHLREIKISDKVDLHEHRVERFVTMELTQGDGEQATAAHLSSARTEAPPRRQFRLPEDDEEYLDSLGLRWETIVDSSGRWVLIHGHLLPLGYAAKTVTIAVRIEGGYPPGKLDMSYFLPPLARADGVAIRKVEPQAIDGSTYQRWSRHYEWREGIDTLATHHLRIKTWLNAEPNR